jgi:hypothetical protein
MSTKVWTWNDDAERHVVEIEHSWFSGKRTLKVDGKIVETSGNKWWDTGSEHRFKAGSKDCVLRIRNNWFGFNYELFVDGKLV